MQLKQGTILQGGKYEIVRMLGQGGFGITYEAIQVSLGRKVAIKEFFMKEYCDRDADTSYVTLGSSQGSRELVEKFRSKFLREARMIASQDHPNIVKIYDVFEENGTAYYVMEHLSGGSLADLVKQHGPLDEKSARDYITQVGSALSHLHEQNCLHFDVKPSNILLNRFGKAVLIDFGISKHYDQGGNQTSSTPVGISKGFAPLEQYQQAEIETFTPATDIYALGATLYYLVAGKTPPSASEVNEDGLERPSGLSDQSWHVIQRAMQPRRKDRPQSIAEFLQLFDETPSRVKEDADETVVITQKKEPTVSPSDKPIDVDKQPSKTWLWIVLGVVAVAVIVLAIVLGKKSPSPQPKTDMAVLDTIKPVLTPEPAKQPEATVISITGIKLSKTSLELEEGQSTTLKATVTPNNATDKTVTWKSYDEQIVTVSKSGKVTAKKVGTATVVARCGEQEASCKVIVKEKPAPVHQHVQQQPVQQQPVQQQPVQQQPVQQTPAVSSPKTGFDNGHEWVDLGLPSGTKWATCNVGASSPQGKGNYYAWGETSTKSDYTWETYRFRTRGKSYKNVHFSKYNTDRSHGTVDKKTRLDLGDDAARANWGGRWRTPTEAQWQELKDKCNWSWTGSGYKVTGPNGQSITLPAAGCRVGSSSILAGSYGGYWSSSLYSDSPYNALSINFSSEDHDVINGSRDNGYSVRPVTE